MAAMARFQLHHPSPFIKPSTILSKFPPSSASIFTINTTNCNNHLSGSTTRSRKLSTTSAVASNSESSSANAESSYSIVSDLLDYLNESWTHFHATAEAKRQLVTCWISFVE
ncbi:Zn-dependent exopeptidase superfamily protein [Forsythia ovata]|uniref:Zn-dependent exopeptidase superfamily protein n=1 Tax=Forsythia ovata TaxID=205694 RepID=A0ABD1X1E8_9LAMI